MPRQSAQAAPQAAEHARHSTQSNQHIPVRRCSFANTLPSACTLSDRSWPRALCHHDLACASAKLSTDGMVSTFYRRWLGRIQPHAGPHALGRPHRDRGAVCGACRPALAPRRSNARHERGFVGRFASGATNLVICADTPREAAARRACITQPTRAMKRRWHTSSRPTSGPGQRRSPPHSLNLPLRSLASSGQSEGRAALYGAAPWSELRSGGRCGLPPEAYAPHLLEDALQQQRRRR